MNALPEQLKTFVEQAWNIWRSGGWAMPAIAAVAIILFGLGVHIFLSLRGKGFESVRESTWRNWIDHPKQRRGPIGRLLNYVTQSKSVQETSVRFDEWRAAELAPFQRDLHVMKICVSAAPLLGLLGTVTGMLETFGALASGAGGEKTMGLVAAGISEALITTETGLVIALPGLFFQYQLARKFERYKAFLAHLETVCTQAIHARLREANPTRAARQQSGEAVVHIETFAAAPA